MVIKSPESSRARVRRTSPYMPIPLALLALFFTVLAIQSFSTPTNVEEVVGTQTLKQEVTFDYTAIPKASTLYPVPAVLGRQSNYLISLIDQFTFKVVGTVASPQGQEVSGTHKVVMQLQAKDLWTKDYVLSQERSFSGTGDFTAIDFTVNIPIHELLAFSDQVVKEAGVSPSSFRLSVTPQVRAEFSSGEVLLTNEFSPCFEFELSKFLLTPRGLPGERYDDGYDADKGLVQMNSVSNPLLAVEANTVGLLGLRLQVRAARVVCGLLALVFLALTTRLTLGQAKRRPVLTESQLIQKRHGSRFIDVRDGALGSTKQIIMLSTFKSLLSIAEEREKPILHAMSMDGLTSSHQYYLIDEGITYCYQIVDSGDPV